MMNQLIERFPEQLREALTIGEAAVLRPHVEEITNVFAAGLGGSGIGANFASEFLTDELKVPLTINKGYNIPASVTKNTLAIASSYSGNTEETLHAFEQMIQTGAKVVIITSGGKLLEKAKELDLDYILVPGNWPSPRACLGYSFVQQLFILHKLGLSTDKAIESVKSSITLIENDQTEIRALAKKVAEQLNGKIPIIYTTDRMESVAMRFRQQINENAKMLAWHHVVPEMNHNELVGWRDKNNDLAVVYFRNEDDFKRNAVRIDINKEIISRYTDTVIELFSKGNDLVERSLYLVNLGDWITYFLSELHGVDSIEVDVIDYLKKELSKV